MTSIDTLTGWVRRLVAVIIAMTATTAALVGAPAPAGAAVCSSASGVSVVVDFTGATGGLQSVCVAGGAGQSADQVITTAGFALTWVTRQPGFICRVNDVPAVDPCVNTPPPDAYWGVFWSDGKDGAWHYADIGVGGLQVPDGGYIGLAWQTGTRREPGEGATAHPVVTPTATPTPTPTTAPTTPAPTTSGTTKPTKNPTKNPTRTPTKAPTSTGTTTTPPTSPTESSSTTDPSASATTEPPSESPTSSGTDSPSASATEEPSESASTESSTATPSDAASQDESRTEESDRVPTWLTLTILGSLLVAIGMSTYAARRRTRH